MDNNTEYKLEMLETCLSRIQTIAARQPTPTRLFYKEAVDIVNDAIAASYKAGLEDATAKKPTFPIDKFETKV